MTSNQDLGIAPEDLDDVLLKIERSFGIHVQQAELCQVHTCGELCHLISNKMQFQDSDDDCTTQQAFYKLKSAILKGTDVEERLVRPDALMEQIFPKKNRLAQIEKLEKELGFELNVLTVKSVVGLVLAILFSISFVLLFIKTAYGFYGVVLSLIGFFIASQRAKDFTVSTVRELAQKLTAEKYIHVQRQPNTINGKELEAQIERFFRNDLGIEKEELKKDAVVI